MKKYQCTMCKEIFDENEAATDANGQIACPVCGAPFELLELIEDSQPEMVSEPIGSTVSSLEYPKEYVRRDENIRYMAEIHRMAVTGETIIEAMGIAKSVPSWDDILILGAQLDPMPLDKTDDVDTTTVIGKNAPKPMILKNPVYISHMSFGALSREAKIALSKGSAMAGSAMCSGEGGILPEEMQAADKYIFEYVPNLYSVTDDNLKNSDAIEIKIGQGTKPGMGGHLPGDKVTEEIAQIRGKIVGEDVISPSKFKDINSKEDLKRLVEELRRRSDGRPVGIKISAGHIEDDLAFVMFAGVDFVTIDGRGGATGASPKLLRDSSSVPTIFALHRARKYLDSVGSDISLIITGGLRVSSDFAKAIAMGADAVAIATAGMLALGCQQYRICGSGNCPVGIATQDPSLRARLDIEIGAQRVANFLNVSLHELKTYARITGHRRLHDLSISDLYTTSRDISENTNVMNA